MQLQVIQTLEELERLEEDWNQLLNCCSASHVPFLRYEFLSSWWKTLGGGEWQHGELFVIVGRAPDHEISGIAPLFFTKNTLKIIFISKKLNNFFLFIIIFKKININLILYLFLRLYFLFRLQLIIIVQYLKHFLFSLN